MSRSSAPATSHFASSVAVAASVLFAVLLLLPTATPALAQFGSSALDTSVRAPRVFMDCPDPRVCADDYFRTHITFVNWVRDRADADVHVILTATPAGSDGRLFTLDFIGLRNFAGRDDQITYSSLGSDVMSENLEGVTHALGIGLLRYAVETGMGREFELRFVGAPVSMNGGSGNGDGEEQGFYDPWNFWTFRFGLSGQMNIQERRGSRRVNPTLNADRVTENWKMNLSIWSNFQRERIELSDGREVRNDRDSWRVGGLLVRSITDHVSVGVDSRAANSQQNNQRSRTAIRPAVEWNYFPYMEATRRQFLAHYSVGVEHSDYYEETVFGRLEETLPHHRFAVRYSAREQWGNAGMGFEVNQYLHDTQLYSFGINANLSLRVARGLEFNISGEASRVADQIFHPAGDLSDEDILLGRQALPTGYEYQGSIGFNYRWGSTLANVVNNRFPMSIRN